ncbi:hypothetical protein Q6247_26880, partial [Klebsiella pneumoniae]
LISLRDVPHTYSCTYFFQKKNKGGNKQGLCRFLSTGECKSYWIKSHEVFEAPEFIFVLFY